MIPRGKKIKTRPVILLGAICLAIVLAPAGAVESETAASSATVWLVETTPAKLSEAETALGFSLDPALGRCILTAAEQKTLLATIADGEAGRVIGKGSVSLIPGVENEFKSVEEVRVPQRYEARIEAGEPSGKMRVTPADFAAREVGLILRVESSDGPVVGMARLGLSLTASRLTGWQTVGPGAKVPVIKWWRLVTTLCLPTGKAIVLVNRPHEPFDSSAVFRSGKPVPQTVMLLIIQTGP